MAETVRPCQREDAPALAAMFTRTFRRGKQPNSEALAKYFENVIFASAAESAEPRSRVFIDAGGEVRGFIGVWPRRLQMHGRTIEAAVAGSLMVDRPEAHPTAGARLLRSYLAGPQELSFSETANDISQRMWKKVGGECLAATSLDWLRVLRPAGLAVAAATYAFRPASLLRPLASGFDRLIETRGRNPLSLSGAPAGVRVEDATSEELAGIIPELSRSFALYPDWNSPSLAFLLSHAEAKERYGETHRQIVYSHAGRPIGCYIFFARRGDIARVLQVLAAPDHAGVTLDSLFHEAAALGCVGVRGRVDAGVLEALIARRCLLFHGSAMVVHARDKALLEEVRNAPALLTGLAGESWTRFVGGEFA